MPSNSANRETVRDHLASLLDAALTGDGSPVEAVYGYLKSDFEKKSPVVMVVSDGIRRRRPHVGATRYVSDVRLGVLVWVADADSAQGWTDQDVDDRLDLLEKSIADVVADNPASDYWRYLTFDGAFTDIQHVTIGSTPYVLEVIPVIAEMRDPA